MPNRKKYHTFNLFETINYHILRFPLSFLFMPEIYSYEQYNGIYKEHKCISLNLFVN